MKKIKVLLKNNRTLYQFYKLIFSTLLRFIGVFCKVDDYLILFNSFGGKKYDDSPKVIFEYMRTQKKYEKYTIYWAFENPDDFQIEGAKKVKIDTLKYFIIGLRSKYWITNSAIERGLKFKKKKTIYINTWHGTPIKKMGIDSPKNAFRFENSMYDVFFAQSGFDVAIFSKAFGIPKDKFVLSGLPRNDELVKVSEEEIKNIKKKLNLPLNKKIILYAPTFREYNRDINGCLLAPPINLKIWQEKLGKDYIVLFRAHYEVNKVLGIKENNFIKNYSNYSNLNELLKISDILISDYSSIMIDYSILERPILNYIYDYEEYREKRGLYFDLKEKLSCFTTETELLNKLCTLNYSVEKNKTKKFKKEFIEKAGEARMFVDNIIE